MNWVQLEGKHLQTECTPSGTRMGNAELTESSLSKHVEGTQWCSQVHEMLRNSFLCWHLGFFSPTLLYSENHIMSISQLLQPLLPVLLSPSSLVPASSRARPAIIFRLAWLRHTDPADESRLHFWRMKRSALSSKMFSKLIPSASERFSHFQPLVWNIFHFIFGQYVNHVLKMIFALVTHFHIFKLSKNACVLLYKKQNIFNQAAMYIL